MVVKILDFRLFESLKSALSKPFCSPKLSFESWILHCLWKNVPEYPPEIIILTSIIVYLISQHFSWSKNYKLFILKPVPGAYFASAKTISAFVICWPVSTAHDEDGSQERCAHLISLLVAKIFTSSL